jgi:hypothetical protein
MGRKPRRRLWFECGLATLNGALVAITLLWHDWIEVVFRVDPDDGSGAIEWLVTGAFLASTLVFTVLAAVEWRRAALVSR